MATTTKDFVTIANIIKHEIKKRKKQKKLKENSKDVEENNMSLVKKIEKKMKEKKVTQLTTKLHDKKAKKLYTTICDDNDKYLNKSKTGSTELNKNELINSIPVSNASEDEKELSLLKSPLKNTKKKKKKSKMAMKEDTELSKYESIQKNLKSIENLKKNISEEQSNEIYHDSTMINTSKISKVYEVVKYPYLFHKLLKNERKDQKRAVKVEIRTHKEEMLPQKLNKRQTIDIEYSKNYSPQSVDMDLETYYDGNNYISKDSGMKLEFFDSWDDHTSENRTMTDTSTLYFDQCCNQTLNNVNGVHSHDNVPLGNTPLQCDVCFRTCISKSKLYEHKRTHTGEKPYACDVCGLSFSKLGNLVTHKRKHTGEKPYTCDVCGRSFSEKGTLIAHKRTHTGEKPYACNVCGRSFSKKGNLRVHCRIHIGEKPFECGQCEKKFSVNDNRTKHILRIHTKCF
ncbi:zinc finger protein 37-like isoform X1 [Metopolophium dirhodum]|uniref:zinc finger protein 37-like isoform X1 n=1 Tax=Metopolophium dirhodum TaxID=44670 RepID=UPI0029905624|nr:zinc finger protein 37-like isoform X1 [Metopolophium dirhodum]